MKRLLAIAILLMLGTVIIMSGCSKSESGEPTGSMAPTVKNNNAIPEKFNPPIELTTVYSANPTLKYPNGDNENSNVWTRHLEETFGIKVKSLWSVPAAQYDQKANLMIASGDIPNFFVASPQQFRQLADAGLLEDMTKVYKNMAPEIVKKVMDDAGPEVIKSAMIDGKLMAIPFSGVAKESVPVIWVREDWLRKLNLPEPKTMDDLINIATAFATKDPDGNGKNDTIGLALDKEFTYINGFFNGFHAYRSIWLKDATGNKLEYSTIQPSLKTALSKVHDMYKSGAIDKEFGTKDTAKVNEDITAGKVGMLYNALTAAAFPLKPVIDGNPTAEWKAYSAPSADGKLVKLQHPLNIYMGYWVVKKGTKNPEAILKMAEFWLNTFYFNTSDDVFHKFVNAKEDNSPYWTMSPVKLYRAYKNVDNYRHLVPYLENKQSDQNKLTPEERSVLSKIQSFLKGDRSNWAQNKMWGLDSSGKVADQYFKNDQFMPEAFITSPLPSMVEKGPNLKKMEIEMMTKIVIDGSLNEFDKFVENWKKLGGSEITKDVNDWYTKNK